MTSNKSCELWWTKPLIPSWFADISKPSTGEIAVAQNNNVSRKRKLCDDRRIMIPSKNLEFEDAVLAKLLAKNHHFLYENYVRNPAHPSKGTGDSKRDLMRYTKYATINFKDMMGTSQKKLMSYIYYSFLKLANEIESDSNVIKVPLRNGAIKNDHKRLAANMLLRLKRHQRVLDILKNITVLLKEEELVGEDAFPCSGSGEDDSITLLFALIDCMKQKYHFDYDPELFVPHANYADNDVETDRQGSYMFFQGASLFINFSWDEEQTIDLDEFENATGAARKLVMPPMSITCIAGNLKHAGSANKRGKPTRKFFLYYDPCRGCRLKGTFKDGNDNYIWFDNCHKKYRKQ